MTHRQVVLFLAAPPGNETSWWCVKNQFWPVLRETMSLKGVTIIINVTSVHVTGFQDGTCTGTVKKAAYILYTYALINCSTLEISFGLHVYAWLHILRTILLSKIIVYSILLQLRRTTARPQLSSMVTFLGHQKWYMHGASTCIFSVVMAIKF